MARLNFGFQVKSLKQSVGVVSAEPSDVFNESKVLIGVVFDSKNQLTLRYVVPKGPADRADLKNGDMLLYVNGKPTSTVQEFVSEINKNKPQDVVKVSYVRGGKLYDVNVTVDAPPAESYARISGER